MFCLVWTKKDEAENVNELFMDLIQKISFNLIILMMDWWIHFNGMQIRQGYSMPGGWRIELIARSN